MLPTSSSQRLLQEGIDCLEQSFPGVWAWPQSWKRAHLLTAFHRQNSAGWYLVVALGVAWPRSHPSGPVEREKGKDPIQPSLNSGLKAICHQPASVVKTHKQRPVSLEQSWGHTEATSAGLSCMWSWVCSQTLSSLERRRSRCTKPCSSAFGSFFLNTGLFF